MNENIPTRENTWVRAFLPYQPHPFIGVACNNKMMSSSSDEDEDVTDTDSDYKIYNDKTVKKKKRVKRKRSKQM